MSSFTLWLSVNEQGEPLLRLGERRFSVAERIAFPSFGLKGLSENRKRKPQIPPSRCAPVFTPGWRALTILDSHTKRRIVALQSSPARSADKATQSAGAGQSREGILVG